MKDYKSWFADLLANSTLNNGFDIENEKPAVKKYPYVITIDEPGMGYAEPCYSYEAAIRAVNKLRAKGYNAIIKKWKIFT